MLINDDSFSNFSVRIHTRSYFDVKCQTVMRTITGIGDLQAQCCQMSVYVIPVTKIVS